MEDDDDVSDAVVSLLTSAAAALNWPIGSFCGRGPERLPPPGPPQ